MFTLPAPTAISDMHPDLQYCTKGYKIYKSGSNREDITVETFSGGNMPAIYPVTRNNPEIIFIWARLSHRMMQEHFGLILCEAQTQQLL